MAMVSSFGTSSRFYDYMPMLEIYFSDQSQVYGVCPIFYLGTDLLENSQHRETAKIHRTHRYLNKKHTELQRSRIEFVYYRKDFLKNFILYIILYSI